MSRKILLTGSMKKGVFFTASQGMTASFPRPEKLPVVN
jgi:hypothetical protein